MIGVPWGLMGTGWGCWGAHDLQTVARVGVERLRISKLEKLAMPV